MHASVDQLQGASGCKTVIHIERLQRQLVGQAIGASHALLEGGEDEHQGLYSGQASGLANAEPRMADLGRKFAETRAGWTVSGKFNSLAGAEAAVSFREESLPRLPVWSPTAEENFR